MHGSLPINFTAFYRQTHRLSFWQNIVIASLSFFAALFVLSYFALDSSFATDDHNTYITIEAIFGFSELVALALAATAALRHKSVKARYQNVVFRDFTTDNGWSPIESYNLKTVAAILIGDGMNYSERYAFHGEYGGLVFDCLIFQFDTDAYKYSAKMRSFICLSFTLPKAYPMIIIDNKMNDHGYRHNLSNLPSKVPKESALSLEGDFDEYFQVSTTKGAENKTLRVLSPNFMSELVDRANNKVDIEISNKNVFLIYESDFYSEHAIKALFDVAETVTKYMSKLSVTWAADSKHELNENAQSALRARHSLIFKSDILSFVFFIICLIAFYVFLFDQFQS
jgi:hypothetical protein